MMTIVLLYLETEEAFLTITSMDGQTDGWMNEYNQDLIHHRTALLAQEAGYRGQDGRRGQRTAV